MDTKHIENAPDPKNGSGAPGGCGAIAAKRKHPHKSVEKSVAHWIDHELTPHTVLEIRNVSKRAVCEAPDRPRERVLSAGVAPCSSKDWNERYDRAGVGQDQEHEHE